MRPVSVWETDSMMRTLTDVEGAALFLLTKWPTAEDTTLHLAARQAALDALDGKSSVEAFRAALVAAAEEAGILA